MLDCQLINRPLIHRNRCCQINDSEIIRIVHRLDYVILSHSHSGHNLLYTEVQRHDLQTRVPAELALECHMKFLLVLGNFSFMAVFIHHLRERRADKSGRNSENGNAENTYDSRNETADKCDRRSVREPARIPDILGKCPYYRSPSIVVHVRLDIVFHKEEDK